MVRDQLCSVMGFVIKRVVTGVSGTQHHLQRDCCQYELL
jgi:hypothetical protein